MTKDADDHYRERYQRILDQARNTALDEAAGLSAIVNPASDEERLHGDPGAGAMGAIIEYRNKIRALRTKS
jgi:hypothetical protein